MTWQVTLRKAAREDIKEACDWYEEKRAGLGDEFLFAIIGGMTRLEENPFRVPLYYRDYRRLITDRFPYKIFFRIDGEQVVVYRVLNGARDHTRELWG